MKAVKWNSQSLIARGDGFQKAIAGMIVDAESGEHVRVQIERSKFHRIMGRTECVAATFREGCIKAVELGIWPLPQKARVLAEIHRRFDHVPEADCASVAWQTSVAAILDFAGAWALAARLMQAGLRVSVLEENLVGKPSGSVDEDRVDVELVIPIGTAKDV
ncbi:hypothetical protein KAT84_01275 [Candidatus Bipolaricaulota bacterium]|nr:hypothetical protein [Candidatus Bipolaricaulota bacterium]